MSSHVRFVAVAVVSSLAFVVLVFLLVGMLLEPKWEYTTVRQAAVPHSRVAAVVGDLSTWETWSAWRVELGSPTTTKVEGDKGMPGHALVWSGPLGGATLRFLTVTPTAIEYEYFATDSQGRAGNRGIGRIGFVPDGDGTRLSWTDGGTWDSLIGRWIGWFGALQERAKELQAAALSRLAQQLEGDAMSKQRAPASPQPQSPAPQSPGPKSPAPK